MEKDKQDAYEEGIKEIQNHGFEMINDVVSLSSANFATTENEYLDERTKDDEER
ncbi:hypothetical protein GJU40_14025 [Bacillus lacus]|uniref:Uncharacterized protein n=1 Tax=Metabacillus lacus TaxID=1983721 RepID=A0A7X2J0N0_9BACI|nr:hypothetical protein [Metabacillus lacus]MRX73261.1 hypothetical protein [Metabacillus lacus]